MTNARKVNLPASILIRNVAGKGIALDVSRIPDAILGDIFAVGAKTVLTNAFNGGGKDATDAAKLDAMTKKMEAWYRGEFNVTTRGDSAMTAMREQYVDERRAATSATRAQVEAQVKATVKSVFGDKESATFSRFLDAVATVKAKESGEPFDATREAIEASLWARTEKAAQKRAEVSAKLDVSSIDLGL